MSAIIAIPAYNPTEKLKEVVSELLQHPALINTQIIVINDGSDKKNQIFETLKHNPRINLVVNEKNKGKGCAIKESLKIAESASHSNVKYLITVDADAQHLTADVVKVYQASLATTQDSLILGVRKFPLNKTPLRSFLGNYLTRFLYCMLYQRFIKDTQTGLRAYPRRSFKALMQISYDRFEFEMSALIMLSKLKLPIEQVEIETVYHDKNIGSNFNPIVDSIKIYKVLVKHLF
jgi:glycosyltransferase involved in cell wall biosynthesis